VNTLTGRCDSATAAVPVVTEVTVKTTAELVIVTLALAIQIPGARVSTALADPNLLATRPAPALSSARAAASMATVAIRTRTAALEIAIRETAPTGEDRPRAR
jgi:hypothetical protein